MTDFLTIITVTIVNEDGESACHSDVFRPDEPYNEDLQTEIDRIGDEASSKFTDDYGGYYRRAIVNINKLPIPKLNATIVNADLPEGSDAATVTATIS